MDPTNNIIHLTRATDNNSWDIIESFFQKKQSSDLNGLVNFINNFDIDITTDSSILENYLTDWANNKGEAIGLCRPKNANECGIIIRCFYKYRMPYTLCAGQTALTGSSCPSGGFVVSLEKMRFPLVKVDLDLNTIDSPVGIYLEDLRTQVQEQSQGRLIYPVDPTSRNEAMIGGTISCNASGFVPGQAGSTRYWVEGIEFIFPNGYGFFADRGQYVSDNSLFNLKNEEELVIFKVPTYSRPKIKNASGPYSSNGKNVDIVDCIIGSEGIYGMITRCKLKAKVKPKGYLDLFLCLNSEQEALDFYNKLSEYLDGNLSLLNALEYFGYNCQKFMKHKNHFFKSKNQVGIYMQTPIDNSFDETCLKWMEAIDSFKMDLDDSSIFVLNDKRQRKLFFEARHSMPVNALEQSKELKGEGIITDTIVPPYNFSKFLENVHKIISKSKIEYLLFGHLGDCHLHFHLIPSSDQETRGKDVYNEIVKLSSSLGGVYSAEHGTGKRKRNDFIECYGKSAMQEVLESKLSVDCYSLVNKGNVIKKN